MKNFYDGKIEEERQKLRDDRKKDRGGRWQN
jgi:hypothetical protein